MKIFFIVILFAQLAFSQAVTVTASVDSQSIVIGDWIRYSVDIHHPVSLSVKIPAFKDTIGIFDVIQQDSLLRSEQNGRVDLKKVYVISKYEAGTYYIQPYIVQYRAENGKIVTAASNPIPVEIRGIEVDTSQTIKDVKPPLTVPMSAEEIAVYLGIVIVLAGLGYGIYYYIKKRRRERGEFVEEKLPNIPPHVLALMQLEQLEAKRLWQAGDLKTYYSEATEIIRRYFELRYGIMALEMTTGEVMMQLEKFSIEKNIFNIIESMLSGADLVKFAKYQPVASENEEVILQARTIVEHTKPIEVVQIKEETTVVNQ